MFGELCNFQIEAVNQPLEGHRKCLMRDLACFCSGFDSRRCRASGTCDVIGALV